MSNDDCSALCPRCLSNVKIATLMKNKIVTGQSIYCSRGDCSWEESWKKDSEFGGFIKQ